MLAFNSYGIVYDNSPWRPGRDMTFSAETPTEDDERRLKNNLATRIMSNGVEVVVKEHNSEFRSPSDSYVKMLSASTNLSPTAVRNKAKLTFGPGEQRKNKKTFSSLRIPTSPELNSSSSNKTLMSSSVATVLNHQHMTALFPLKQLMKHNYIIKTCLTTYTYLTTVVQNKKSAVSTFETVISVVTTESLTKLFATDLIADIKPTKTKFMDLKTVQSTAHHDDLSELSAFTKLEKRIDNLNHDDLNLSYEIIQPSEVSFSGASCSTTSCSCSHIKTENMEKVKTKYTHSIKYKNEPTVFPLKRVSIKPTKIGSTKYEELTPTRKQSIDNTDYGPYKYETSQIPPSEKVVEKYTEVINDYSDEKEVSAVEESELLTNEEAPSKNEKIKENKKPEKLKEKPVKTNKNKFVVADLLKLGSLGIKGLSQLAPVIEKMTGGFIKRQDINKTTTTTTVKPITKITPYIVNKRYDSSEVKKRTEPKPSNFPIYIPVDELETSESQNIYSNATLHQSLAWAAERKHPKAHHSFSNLVHESPLVNGGIPISPGEIITANSDVIVGKPAVGGPLTLAASGIKLHSSLKPAPYDSQVSSNEHFLIKERTPRPDTPQKAPMLKNDDSFDLRPPELPHLRPRQPPKEVQRHPGQQKPYNEHLRPTLQHTANNQYHDHRFPPNDESTLSTIIQTSNIFPDHGRPAFFDYIPSFNNNKQNEQSLTHKDKNNNENSENKGIDSSVADSNPSSSEIINTRVRNDGEISVSSQLFSESINKPFLVDIQPSRVANVLIPHGSSTALIFAGSSEPHKTGEYIDDPLPYPEPGYFGSFSIDAPQMTMVHNVAPSSVHESYNHNPRQPTQQESHKVISATNKTPNNFGNDYNLKWNKNRRPNSDYNKIPPPTSNQETHLQVGPHIASYNPDIISPSTHDFDKYNHLKERYPEGKTVIDKEYENHLAVPPPPPPKAQFNFDVTQRPDTYKNGRPYNQRPIFHTKPIQDMKVFLNIQHPVPRPASNQHQTIDSVPPKVTSEIYFAAAAPQNDHKSQTYTVHIPAPTTKTPYNNDQNSRDPAISSHSTKNEHFKYNGAPEHTSSFQPYPPDSINTVTAHALNPKPELQKYNSFDDNESVYSVTLNAATNVGNSNIHPDKILGTSVAVPIEGQFKNYTGMGGTGIPIGTNVAIKVDGHPVSFQSFHLSSQHEPPVVYDENGEASDVIIGDNRWNYSPKENQESETRKEANLDINKNLNKPPQNDNFHNSHANFPMINDATTKSNVQDSRIKPVTENVEDFVKIEQKRPSKLIPHIPTNSHGWYSSNAINNININSFENINNLNVDSTTRKTIPLSHSYDLESLPQFGEKIPSIGLPPTNLWNQNNEPLVNKNEKINQFKKPPNDKLKQNDYVGHPPLTTQPYNTAYIPSNFGVSKQPTYPIPVRDEDYYDTIKEPGTSEHIKPVYENSEEIYDGGSDESVNDGEVSLESMKIPVISTMEENKITSLSTSPMTLLQDEVYESTEDYENENNHKTVSFHTNNDSQTEKPFLGGNFNKGHQSPSQFSTQRPFHGSNSHMKPRPFEVNSHTISFSGAPNPHWQINHILGNMTSPGTEEDTNLILNIGEEMTISTTRKPISVTTKRTEGKYTNENTFKRKPAHPIFSLKHNKTKNESTNIITSTMHLSDHKPLTILNITQDESSSTLPNFTKEFTNIDENNSMTNIINLSPPPPTMDYNFKPSSSDEMIMGMSPPPARTPLAPRLPPVRTSAPPRVPPTRPTLPSWTPPPYRNKPMRTLPPRTQPPRTVPARTPQRDTPKDEISTFRPNYDILKNRPRHPPYNRERLPSHLMPPPSESPSLFVPEPSISTPQDYVDSSVSNIVFPTLVSSGWITSSSVEFPSKPQNEYPVLLSFTPSYSHEKSVVSETVTTQRPVYEQTPVLIPNDQNVIPINVEVTNHESTTKQTLQSKVTLSSSPADSIADESNISQEEQASTESTMVIPLIKGNRPQFKKPDESKHATESRFKLPIKPTAVIRNTKTSSDIDTVQHTKIVPTRKKISNMYSPPSRNPSVYRPTIIESSEYPRENEEYTRTTPTEILKENVILSSNSEMVIPLVEKTILKPLPTSISERVPAIIPTHHAGNEVKISDEIIPTKTEFKITAITLTKTLSEPPKTVSTTRFLNLTHTLTVTHTKTSLLSQSAGATTQTLILTNTHTSTVVDVVTEIHTHVQPTTIVETVTKHFPIVQPTPVLERPVKTRITALDDISISSEEDNLIINPGNETTDNIQKLDKEEDNDTFLIVMNKSQNGETSQPVNTDIESTDYDGVTRNEEVNNNGVSQVLFGEILLAGTPYLETTNVVKPTGTAYSKECQPDCKASRNERCQRINGIMKCVCRPGFARMFPDRPCKPTYTYSVKLALSRQGKERLQYQPSLANNASKEYISLSAATHEGINRMVMQSDLRDVFHGIHINGFHPVEIPTLRGEKYTGVANDFYVQLSDNAHETRLKEVIEKYLRTNNYSLGGTDVFAAGELLEQLNVTDFDECHSVQFHDCSEHAQCFNLRGTYTCSCTEGFADMSVNALYPGRICSAEQVGCERCNYHGACYTRDDKRVLCECFQWYAGATCHVNLKVILISLTTVGAALILVLAVCGVLACSRRRPRARPHPIASCIQSIPSLHQSGLPSAKHRAAGGAHDRRALITERADSGDASSVHMSLPYMPAKKVSATSNKGKRCIPDPPTEKAPAPTPCVMIPRARLHQAGREGAGAGGASRKPSAELSEAKLISYLESGSNSNDEMMRRKHSEESSYSLSKERHSKHNAAGALVSAGFKVSTTVKPDESVGADDASSVREAGPLGRHYDTRTNYSQDDISEWTDAERRIGELTLSEARSVGGTLPASTGRAASSARLTHQGSDVSEFDSL